MSATDPLLLEVLRDNNETLRANTKAVTDLQMKVTAISTSSEHLITRVTELETTQKLHAVALKELEDVGKISRQVKKWLIWSIAFGLSVAVVGGLIMFTFGRALMSLLSLT